MQTVKKLLSALLFSLMSLSLLPAQVAFWQKYFGGTGFDKGVQLIYRADGTLILAGEVLSREGLGKDNHGAGSDVVLFKYATQGRYFWKSTFGGSGMDELSDLIVAPDGGYLMVGSSSSADGDVPGNRGGSDVWVVRIGATGELLWSKTFGGSGDDRGLCALITPAGEIFIGGETASPDGDAQSLHHGGLDSWLLRLSSNGRLLWEKHYGGSGNEKLSALLPLSDSTLMLVHSSDSRDKDVKQALGRKDVWVTEVDEKGDISWQASYGGEDNDDIHAAIRDTEGNIVLAGTSFSGTMHLPFHRGEGDAWLFKIAPDGALIWSVSYGGNRADGMSDLIQTADGGYLAVGTSKSLAGQGEVEFNGGYFDGWLIKVNTYGERTWSRTLGYEGKEMLNAVVELPKGGFLTLGQAVQDPKSGKLPGHAGSGDFWMVNFSDPDREGVRPFVTPPVLSGLVRDKTTGKPLSPIITLTDNRTLDSLSSVQADAAGAYLMLLPSYGLVSINALTPGYLFYGQDLLMDSLVLENNVEVNIQLEPIRIGSSLILKNIYFETGKWNLLPASNAELERVVAFMKLNPRVAIQVSGHTDNTGDKNEKMQLSINRANSVRDYLVKRGVAAGRLKVKGYGMYRPIAPNTTPEGRQKNRRVEFEVINM
ncbi:MAG: OmpA family protein [Bacteroidetes bacterium]|nr:MAG: OmpA family protein [Bacteroidota bacterium]